MAEQAQKKLAYILGAIYGDGHFSKEGKVCFSSTDIEFIAKIKDYIKELFGLSMILRKVELSKKNPNWRDSFEFSSRRLYKNLKQFDPHFIIVPAFILDGNKEIKASFLRGFFDAEGSVDFNVIKRKDGRIQTSRHVNCFSNNVELLNYVKKFLEELGIKSQIFHGKGSNYYVGIWNYRSLTEFRNLIGFEIKRKQSLLNEAIKSYKEIQTQWKLKDYEKVLNLRTATKFGSTRLGELLLKDGIKIPQPTIEAWIYGRTKVTEDKSGGVQ